MDLILHSISNQKYSDFPVPRNVLLNVLSKCALEYVLKSVLNIFPEHIL